MDTILIFGAQKLFLLSPLIAAFFFYKMPREARIEMLIFAFFSLPLTFILAMGARELYFNPLPFVKNGLEPLLDHAPNNGFPSDHVLLLAAVAAIFTFFHKKAAISLWVITVFVGLSRMFVGVHHLIDIMASMLIALLSAYAVYAVLEYRKKV